MCLYVFALCNICSYSFCHRIRKMREKNQYLQFVAVAAVWLAWYPCTTGNRKSTTRFPMSLRWSSYVAPKTLKGWRAQKCKTAVFPVKSHFTWRKSASKFLCVKTVSNKFKKHSWLNYRAKMIGGGCTLLHENLAHNDHPLSKRWFSIHLCP